jgi:hypothetical protein
MPFDTHLTSDYMGTILVGTGVVTGSEILEACKSVTALVQSTANFHYKLIDLARVTELRITPEEYDDILEQDRLIAKQRPNDSVAIVATDESVRAIMEEWRHRVEGLGWAVEILPSREEAMAWIQDRVEGAQV